MEYNNLTKSELINIIHNLKELLDIERKEHRDIFLLMKKNNEDLIQLLNIEKNKKINNNLYLLELNNNDNL